MNNKEEYLRSPEELLQREASFGKRIDSLLRERKSNGLLRTLRPAARRKEGMIYFNDKAYVDFSSNDYLCLSSHPRLKAASRQAAEKWGVGSSASRLLSGDLELFHDLEEKTARFKRKESALIFNSGYQANVGIISALCKRGDIVFSDRLNHASIVDGILLSGAAAQRFRHNDIDHLRSLLAKYRHKYREAFIVTETVFSMDGDRCPLKEIVTLSKKYRCAVMVDEAHATGIFGKNGSGVAEEEGLSGEIDLIMGTFSKALGGFGAYLACGKKIKDYLINSSRSFIYSTALPPSVIAANAAALDLIKDEPFRRKTILENSAYFRRRLQEAGFRVKGATQIIPLIAGENEKAVRFSRELKERGYWALPIRPPTVPRGEARVRFSLTACHKKEMLEKLVDDIDAVRSSVP